MKYLFLAIATLFSSAMMAQAAFSTLYKTGDTPTELALGLSWEAFQQRHEELSGQGFTLSDLETEQIEGERQFFGMWKKRGQAAQAVVELVPGWDSLVVRKRAMAKAAYVMQDIEAFTADETEYYLVSWLPGDTPHKVRKLSSWQGLLNDHEELGLRSLHMIDLEGFEAPDGNTYYLALYHRRGPDAKTYLFRSPDPAAFDTDKIYRNKSRHFLFDFELFEKREMRFFFGLYQEALPGDTLLESWEEVGLREQMAEQEKEGMELYDLDVRSLD